MTRRSVGLLASAKLELATLTTVLKLTSRLHYEQDSLPTKMRFETWAMPELRPVPQGDEKFLVAFSFAGEQRELVRTIAEATEQILGWGTVFYDEWYEGFLAGTSADLKLQEIYGERSEVVVMCPSAEYGKKSWTVAEWDSIRARYMPLRARGDGESDRLVPIRVADGEVQGLLANAIWFDARQRTPRYLAEQIVERVRRFVPGAGLPRVFLAQTFDLEDDDELICNPKLKRFIAPDMNPEFRVVPDQDLSELDSDEFAAAVRSQLAGCLAFVQLHSEKYWKGAKYDQLQFDTAQELKLPSFCFCGDILTANRADEKQRLFIERTAPIAGQFQDFKHTLEEKLKELAEAKRAAVRQFQEADNRSRLPVEAAESTDADSQPLVRVAVKAGNGNDIWEPVFNYLFLEEDVLLDELGPNDSFASKQPGEPCHGFLILCDERAQIDDAFSPREALSQCRQIQTQLSQQALEQLPPVGVVFRAPPDPAWSRLLKSTPKCLHRVLGDDLENGLRDFVKQVREVRRAMK